MTLENLTESASPSPHSTAPLTGASTRRPSGDWELISFALGLASLVMSVTTMWIPAVGTAVFAAVAGVIGYRRRSRWSTYGALGSGAGVLALLLSALMAVAVAIVPADWAGSWVQGPRDQARAESPLSPPAPPSESSGRSSGVTFSSHTYHGDGDEVLAFRSKEGRRSTGTLRVELPAGMLRIESLDASGRVVATVLDTTGPYDGDATWDASPEAGIVALKVTSDSTWTFTFSTVTS